MLTHEEMNESVRRIGTTADGKVFRAMLFEMLTQVPPPGTAPGALQEEVGRRTLARRLILLLEEAPNPDARPAVPDPGQPLARSRNVPGGEPARGTRRRRIPGAVDSE